MLLVLPKALAVARGHQRLSFLCNVLTETILDMRAFLVIFFFIMANFGLSFALNVGFEVGEFGSLTDTVFTVYALQLGDFEQDTYRQVAGTGGRCMMALLFFGFTFVINVVALNSLIALMGDSWERTQETADARGLQQRAQLLCEMELGMSDAEKANPDLFPLLLHCLQPVSDDDDDGADTWQGRVVALRRTVDATAKETQTKLDGADKKIGDVAKALETKVAQLDAKLDAIMQLLQSTSRVSSNPPSTRKGLFSLTKPGGGAVDTAKDAKTSVQEL